MKKVRMYFTFCLLNFAFCIAFAADWPQWRGPFLNGSSDETSLPTTWTVSRAKWSASLPGEAGSTPVVCGGRVYLTSTDRASKNLFALCFNAADGRPLWKKTIPGEGRNVPYNKDASPSPVTDGKRAWFLFGNGDFLCVDAAGNTLWQRNLKRDHGPLAVEFLYSASPLLYRGRLYIAMLRDESTTRSAFYKSASGKLDSYLLCVDPATGKDIWRQARPTDDRGIESLNSYATPFPWETKAAPPAIVTVGSNFVTGHDWQNGAELWRLRYGKPGGYRQRVVPTPVESAGMLIVSKPRRGPLYAVRPGGAGELPWSRVAWEFSETGTDTPSVLAYRGRIYILQEKEKTLTCVDPATGRKVWVGNLGGSNLYFASPTAADGKIYCVNLSGEVVVVKAGDTFKLLGKSRLGGAPCYSTVIAAEGSLFIRTANRLYCVTK